MPTLLDPTTKDELPDPAAAHVISKVIVEAWLRSVDRKQGKRFLENLGRVIEAREEMAHVITFRRGSKMRETVKAEREALACIRQMIGSWLLSLPPK